VSIAEPPPLSPPDSTPPHNLDAEQSVLGALLLNERAMYSVVVAQSLKPEHFYRPQHAEIFGAMLSLYEQSEPIDHVAVTERLQRTGKLESVGGPSFVAGLTAAAPTAGNAQHYAKIVHENALLRRLLNTTFEIQQSVYNREADTDTLVDLAERSVLEVAQDDKQKDFVSAAELLDRALDRFQELAHQKTALIGTPSGFKDLDEVTGGFHPGNLIILAARPGMGKSALVTNIAENAALAHGKPVALFSLEMSEQELAQRFVASQANIKGEDLRRGRVDERRWPKILEACDRLQGAPLFVDDTSDVGTTEIRAKARRLHQQSENGLGLVIVDYLQLMRADGRIENRVQQIGEMSRGLKLLANELEVPVIALSQLSRAVESRTDKRPLLSDLRESGNLEQDADLVMFIYRDEYYNKEESEEPGVAEIGIAKNRHGSLDTVKLTFQGEYPKFMNWVDEERY
jgi:replicative DNA helicase